MSSVADQEEGQLLKFVGETITAASPNSAAIVKLWLYQTIKDVQKGL